MAADKRLEQLLEMEKIIREHDVAKACGIKFLHEFRNVWTNAWYHPMWNISVLEKYEPESKQKNKPRIVLCLAPIDGEDGQFHRPLNEIKKKIPSQYGRHRIFVEAISSTELYALKKYVKDLNKEPEAPPTEGELRIAKAEAWFRRGPATNDLLAFLGIQ